MQGEKRMKTFNQNIEHAKKEIKALQILVDRAEELGRVPTKSDMTEEEVFLVKSMFGPLPRALELAGLKEVSEHYKQKQIRRRQKKGGKKSNIAAE